MKNYFLQCSFNIVRQEAFSQSVYLDRVTRAAIDLTQLGNTF